MSSINQQLVPINNSLIVNQNIHPLMSLALNFSNTLNEIKADQNQMKTHHAELNQKMVGAAEEIKKQAEEAKAQKEKINGLEENENLAKRKIIELSSKVDNLEIEEKRKIFLDKALKYEDDCHGKICGAVVGVGAGMVTAGIAEIILPSLISPLMIPVGVATAIATYVKSKPETHLAEIERSLKTLEDKYLQAHPDASKKEAFDNASVELEKNLASEREERDQRPEQDSYSGPDYSD